MSYYRDQLEDWLKSLDVKADFVLDIGGAANPVEGRTKTWDVRNVVILDNNNEKDWHEKWTEPEIHVDLNETQHSGAVLYKLSDLGLYQPDAIFMLEVAEYLKYPTDVVDMCFELLCNGGVFYSSWPAVYPPHNPHESDFLRYTRPYLEDVFSNWSNVAVTPRKATAGRQALAEFYSSERMRAVKKDSSIFDIGYMVKASKK